MDPIQFGLNHNEFNPGQLEAIMWAQKQGTHILQAPTGSGKTAIARALAQNDKAIALVKTRVLQAENYADGYGFDVVFGRNNYPCILSPPNTVEECEFGDNMKGCPLYGQCTYIVARETAKKSHRASLNYTYWLLMRDKWPEPGILVCDEGHQLSEIVLDWAGIEISFSNKSYWGLPQFPMIRSSSSSVFQTSKSHEIAINYLKKCYSHLDMVVLREQARAATGNKKAGKKAIRAERLQNKINATIIAINLQPDDWFIRSGIFSGQQLFIAKPLTAKHHFNQYFHSKSMLIMSATIGDPTAVSTELGIENFDTMNIPHAYEPEDRPVFALSGVPRLGYKSPNSAWEKQADEIAKAIKSAPNDWCGLVLCTSKAETKRLTERLAKRGLQDRVWMTPYLPTEKQIAAWVERKKQFPNSICVSWSLWEGYNGLDERIVVVAKVPYPYLGSEYERTRQKYDGKFFLQRAAWTLMQGAGRTRRQPEDYGPNKNLVVIADGGYKWVRKYMTPDFRDGLVEI